MIFTMGYEGLEREDLVALVGALGQPTLRTRATLIDVRSVPHSRKRGWGSSQLPAYLSGEGVKYERRGHVLGGRLPRVDAEALGELVAAHGFNRDAHALLMCAERSPAACHRHRMIGRALSALRVPCLHLYLPKAPARWWSGEVVEAGELQRAIDAGGTYSYYDLPDVLEDVPAFSRVFLDAWGG